MMMMRAKNTGLCTSCAATAMVSKKGSLPAGELGMPQDVFYHHHRAIHHHAEIERAERQQVRGNVLQVEQNRGKQQGKGNGDGHDKRAAHIAQEQKKNQRDQQHSVGQIAQHGVRRVMHQIAAIQMRDKLHSRRGAGPAVFAPVQFGDLCVQRLERGIGFGAFAQQDDAFDHVVVIDDRAIFAADRFAQLPKAHSWAPGRQLARSRTRTGVPFCTFTTVAPMSSVVCISPTARTFSACSPRSIKPPPALVLFAASACSTWLSDNP